MRPYLCWIVLALGAWRAVAAESPEFYVREGVELEVLRGEGGKAYLTVTRRVGTAPAATAATATTAAKCLDRTGIAPICRCEGRGGLRTPRRPGSGLEDAARPGEAGPAPGVVERLEVHALAGRVDHPVQ